MLSPMTETTLNHRKKNAHPTVDGEKKAVIDLTGSLESELFSSSLVESLPPRTFIFVVTSLSAILSALSDAEPMAKPKHQHRANTVEHPER